MGRKPVGKVAMTPAERQHLYIQRLKAKAAAFANSRQPDPRGGGNAAQSPPPSVTNELTTDAKRKLKRLARHKDSTVAALIEKWATAAENRLAANLKGAALKRYYDGK
jgi:hypothetical protein